MRALLSTPLLLVALSLPAAPADLDIGVEAPPLGDLTWLKGEPVPEYEPGTIYVLDFWATWCGPCRETIPHVNALAARHRDDGVVVVGVAVWPRDTMTPTADYVAGKGDAMDYTVAEDVDRRVATAYMEALGQDGIPTAMIIDREGRLVWVNHPLADLDGAVQQVLDGTFDVEAEAARLAEERRVEAEWQAALAEAQPVLAETRKAVRAKDHAKMIAGARALVATHPRFLGWWRPGYDGLVGLEEYDEARAWFAEIYEQHGKDSPGACNMLAWTMVDPGAEHVDEARDLDLVLAIARRACELSDQGDPSCLDTLARVHFVRGERREAVEIQERAVELAADDQREGLERTLEEYRRAGA